MSFLNLETRTEHSTQDAASILSGTTEHGVQLNISAALQGEDRRTKKKNTNPTKQQEEEKEEQQCH